MGRVRISTLTQASVLALLVVAAEGPPGAMHAAQSRADKSKPSVESLRTAFAAGDAGVVDRTITTFDDYRALLPSLNAAIGRTPKPSDATEARFWLELARVAAVVSPFEVGRLLSYGRQSARLGSGDAAAAFERVWHQTALALLQQIKRPDLQEIYLKSLEARYRIKFDDPATGPRYGRFLLDRGIAKEQACWLSPFPSAVTVDPKTNVPIASVNDGPQLTTIDDPTHAWKLDKSCRDALRSFDRATAVPDVAAEALLRGATSRFRIGMDAEALATIRRITAAGPADAVRDYWAALIEGRVAQHARRLDESAHAYQRAATLIAGAQAPRIGLAMVLFDLNRRDEAVEAAEAVMAMPASAYDPWWDYLAADARFVAAWREALKESSK